MNLISPRNRLRVLILILVIAIWVYDWAVYFYQSFYNFLYYAAMPTSIIMVVGLLLFYIPINRKMRVRTMEFVEASGNAEKAISVVEDKIEQHRQKAMANPSKLPELVKRLVALSVYYKAVNPERSDNYAKEAIGYLNSLEYPDDRNASEIKKAARLVIDK